MKKLDEPTAAFVEKVRTGIASIKKLRGRIEPRTSERIVATCIELHSACDEMEGLVELAEEAQPEPEPAPEPAPEPKPESKQKGGKK